MRRDTGPSRLGFANSLQVPSGVLPGPGAGGPVWVRLHLLAGALPLAGYLVLHLGTQAFAWGGPFAYARANAAIDRTPWLQVLEVAFLYVPLGYQVGAGLWRMRSAAWLSGAGQGRGWRAVQQLSGGVLLAFLIYHFWQFRGRLWTGELDRSDYFPELCASLSSTALGGVPVVALGYLLGMAAAAFHAADGLYRFWLGWSIAAKNQPKRAIWCCTLAGLSLFLLGTLIVIDLATGSVVIHWPG
jgi:succinate dehydrogenase cytochrome b subunit